MPVRRTSAFHYKKALHLLIILTNNYCDWKYFHVVWGFQISRRPPYSHISDYMIKELHWLPILACVRYKVLLLVAKSKQGLAPRYLCELMSKPLSARSSRPLRSADCCDLLVPWSRTSLSQNRAFTVVGPALWNDTPLALRVWCYMEYHLRPYEVWTLLFSPSCHAESESE